MNVKKHYDSEISVESLLKKIPAIRKNTNCMEVLNLFHADKTLYALPIINDKKIPIGIILRLELMEVFSRPYSISLYSKKSISSLMDKNPLIVDENSGIEDVYQYVLKSDGKHMLGGLIITKNKLYLGMVTSYDLLNEITKQKQKYLFDLAHFDQLTGLPNRRLLIDKLQENLTKLEDNCTYGVLLLIDLDNFKTVNDTLGHHIGDILLQQVALRLRDCVRKTDVVARINGDEFIIMIDGLKYDIEKVMTQVKKIGEKILLEIAKPYQLSDCLYQITPSVGATLFMDCKYSPEELIKQADIAMYKVKKSGRNSFSFFMPAMQQEMELHSALEFDLRSAILLQQLHLYYQIQIDSNQKIIGAEALIRWIHPIRGMVSPLDFIPVAEETSLIIDIGDWVLGEACRQLAKWGKNEKTCNLTLAVNISANQFKQPNFVEKILALLKKNKVNPARLKLELTESVVLTDLTNVIEKMTLLKNIGIGLSMDDFGTGYSSLSYLKRLPINQLKIDKSFIRDVITDSNDAVMVKTIIDLAKSFDLNVIAEGVETEAQYEFLAEYGCMAYQGYLFSKPIPLDSFEHYVTNYLPK